MSLISDPDFLIHRTRLAYLRMVDDPYAPRIISLAQDYALNPHIIAAGLADPDRWPELIQPHSPPPSPPPSPTVQAKTPSATLADPPVGRHRHRREPRRHSGFPGAAGLKYSDTIVGPNRTGAMGLGVNLRKRTSTRPSISSLSRAGSVRIDVQPASPSLVGSALASEATASAGSTPRPGRSRADSEPTPGAGELQDDSVARKRSSSEAEAPAPPTAIPASQDRPPSAPTSPTVQMPPTTIPAGAAPAHAPPPFIPKFKVDPRMEDRRRMRMNARAQAQAALQGNIAAARGLPPPAPAPMAKTVKIINPDTSSEEESAEEDKGLLDDSESDSGSESSGTDSDEDSGFAVVKGPVDEVDEFNPDFAAPRTHIVESASDGASLEISVSSASASHSSFASSPPPIATHHHHHGTGHHMQVPRTKRTRLSPVSEGRGPEAELEFEMVNAPVSMPAMNGKANGNANIKPTTNGAPPIPKRSPSRPSSSSSSISLSVAPVPGALVPRPNGVPRSPSATSITHPDPLFARRPVPALPSTSTARPSLLTTLLASSSASTPNPFAELYALVSGRAESESVSLLVYFPFSDGPPSPDGIVGNGKSGRKGRARREPEPMECVVRKDAIVEEVVGFALWRYWEEDWTPRLDEGIEVGADENGEGKEKDPRLTANGWVLRVTEDDGEVDEDLPDLSRLMKISKLKFPGYAIVRASTSQINSNRTDEAKITRHPSRIMAPKKAPTLLAPALSIPAAPSQSPQPSPSAAPAPHATQGQSPSAAAPAATAAELAVPAALAPPSVSGPVGSTLGGSMLGGGGMSLGGLPHSLGPSSSHGPQVFLRIRVADTQDAVHISTTIPVSAGMYMQEALELVLKRRKLDNPREWALLLPVAPKSPAPPPPVATSPDPENPAGPGGGNRPFQQAENAILIPLDRTVASLQGKYELLLVKRSALAELGVVDLEKSGGRSTDPNASIFKRISDVPEENAALALLNSAYKKYTVVKKTPMLVTRQERALAIDGDYIHIMPSGKRAVFDSGRTISFHIKSVVACQQSSKSSATFKLEVGRDSGNPKRYDFEAESSRLAREIQDNINGLKKTYMERTGMLPRSRRSRHVT